VVVVVGGNANESGNGSGSGNGVVAAVCDMNAEDVGLAPHASNSEYAPSAIHVRAANRCYQMGRGKSR